MITIIAAITRDNALGRGGDMLYHLSDDLRRFRLITMGHPIIMGRRTFESFPRGPLPGRRNMVVTRNAEYAHDGIEVYASLSEAIDAAGDNAYIIGGGQIYAQAMPFADRLCMTHIDVDGDGADTHFPEIDPRVWIQVAVSDWLVDQRSGVRYRYVDYGRR